MLKVVLFWLVCTLAVHPPGYGTLKLLQDTLYYASSEFKPHTVIDIATLTGYVTAFHASA